MGRRDWAFTALQVRRPSSRPQGLLNIGMAVWSMSLASKGFLEGAKGGLDYRKLMGDEIKHRDGKKKKKKKEIREMKCARFCGLVLIATTKRSSREIHPAEAINAYP
ncbi:hypothetical protein AMTR_s00156p00040110 [Amborella trichopoda]|uniref:Uncharacterized protein n=1 Tax=Amborella trichopoda TaxID=13333 RepID=W1PMB5_AMBTC|nr:hypothetical protein AMTR_s00156p00040110 [Amborella trichopoda]